MGDGVCASVPLMGLDTLATIAGTIVAALIGVIGLALVLLTEAKQRYRDRLDVASADVIRALSDRAAQLDAWASESPPATGASSIRALGRFMARRDHPGGPIDSDLQAAAEVLWLTARHPNDRAPAKALADTTWALKRALVSWQIGRTGSIAASVRQWRVGEITAAQFIAAMADLDAEILASETAYQQKEVRD